MPAVMTNRARARHFPVSSPRRGDSPYTSERRCGHYRVVRPVPRTNDIPAPPRHEVRRRQLDDAGHRVPGRAPHPRQRAGRQRQDDRRRPMGPGDHDARRVARARRGRRRRPPLPVRVLDGVAGRPPNARRLVDRLRPDGRARRDRARVRRRRRARGSPDARRAERALRRRSGVAARAARRAVAVPRSRASPGCGWPAT